MHPADDSFRNSHLNVGETAGTYSFKVRVRDQAAQKDWRLFTITVM